MLLVRKGAEMAMTTEVLKLKHKKDYGNLKEFEWG